MKISLTLIALMSLLVAPSAFADSWKNPTGCIPLSKWEIEAHDGLNKYVQQEADKEAADDGCTVSKVQIKNACAKNTESDGLNYYYYAQILEKCGKRTKPTWDSGKYNPQEQLFKGVCSNASNTPMPGGWKLLSPDDIKNNADLQANALTTAQGLAGQKNCEIKYNPNIVIACSQVVNGLNYQYGAISTFKCADDPSFFAPFNNTMYIPAVGK